MFGNVIRAVADKLKADEAFQQSAQPAAAPAPAPAPTLGQLDQQRAQAGQVNAVPRPSQLTMTQKMSMMAGNMNDDEFNKLIAPLDDKTRAIMLEQRQRYIDSAKAQGVTAEAPTLAQIDQQRMATGSNLWS